MALLADLTPSPFRRVDALDATSPYAIIEIEPHSLPPPADGYMDLVLDDDEVEPDRPERSGREPSPPPSPKGVPDDSRTERAAPSASRDRAAPRVLVPEALVLAAFLAVGGVTAVVAMGARSGHAAAPPVTAQPVAALAPRLPPAPIAPPASPRTRPPIEIPPLEPAPPPPVLGIVALETPPAAEDGTR